MVLGLPRGLGVQINKFASNERAKYTVAYVEGRQLFDEGKYKVKFGETISRSRRHCAALSCALSAADESRDIFVTLINNCRG